MVVPAVGVVERTVVAKKTPSKTVERMYDRRVRELGRMQSKATGEKPSMILYMVVGVFALLKDVTDLLFGLIPVIGIATAVVFGFCISTIIYLLLTAFDRSGGAQNLRSSQMFIKRLLVLLGTMMVDIIPLLNFLPITTLSVMLLYWMAKREWKQGAA